MREHTSALFIILEHVQTGACRGKQHGIAVLSQLGAALGSCLYRVDTNQRHGITQRLCNQLGIATQQHRSAAVFSHGGTQAAEVGTFAIATGDQHQLADDIRAQAFDSGQCSTHVGGLGIVVVVHAIALAQPLAAVLKAGELTQAGKHGVERQAHGMPQRQGCQCVSLIVCAANFQLAHRHQVLELECQEFFAVLFTQTKAVEVRLVEAESPARQAFADQRTGQRVLPIDHHLPRATENTVLGEVIGRQTGITVHMVFADVQYGRHFGIELISGFELKTGQLHHVQLDIIAEQVQRRGAQIAAHSNTLAGSCGHLADQRGHGAFRVGTGNRNHRCLGVTGKQFDVAGQLDAACMRLLQGRCGQGQTRADIKLVGTAEEVHVQFATPHFHLRIVTTQSRQLRRIFPRVGHSKGHAPVRQEANQGHATLAKPHNNAEAVGNDQGHSFYLSFNVARPMSTRITVMIQKRTITRGSGQPLSSKWW
ncbi:Uncharacterized protein ALO88_05612 [Pseudomonas syringae pv. antirrhini]|uniref:Uncharacterized protein n=1 Tax=Pseudomonas syringae pv. antirrhini TaxID=251702 RepID=A0A0P9NQG6_9PSED|nr:Uncharacterized protein ALO88_05612 [Pseudomonas syringae pv. antirrhini]